ncbi:MAG: hypothetical protein ACTH8P_16795 [Ewingella sp.]|uniref:hypothetical protein n=1 Tax=Ewingella sp. TaxID=1897459 RepID=UPI003F8F6380
MPQPMSVIQKRSDKKRRVKALGLKLPYETIDLMKWLAHETNKTQTAILIEALDLLAANVMSKRD